MSYVNNLDFECIKRDLTENGYSFLPSIKSNLLALGTFEKYVERYGSQTGYKENSAAHLELYDNLGLEELYRRVLMPIMKQNGVQNVDGSNRYFISRFVNGGDSTEAYRGHFDSHYFTIVLPVKVAKNQSTEIGELIAFPKARSEPHNELINIAQKIYWKRYASADGFKKLMRHRTHIEEHFQSYSPLIFLGRTTFHGNNFVSSDAGERLSFLCHFNDISGKNGIGAIVRKLRRR